MIYSAELVAVGDFTSKKSEKLKDDIWSDIEEPPVNGVRMSGYGVVFDGSSHYYFGGYDDYHGNKLHSILRLQSGSWKWSNVGRINSARGGHAIILVSETFMVVGGSGNHTNEACFLNDGQFNCDKMPSSLYWYNSRPILFSVGETYGSC